MDLVMPEMNGMQAAQLLHDRYPDIKILILSMYDDDEYVCQILKAGASGYVLKRAAGEDLLRAIREIENGGSSLHPTVAAKLIKDYVGEPNQQSTGIQVLLLPPVNLKS